MHNSKKLKIWVEAIDLTIEIYSATKQFPDAEKFGLISQLRRASVSVASNIAEGSGRKNTKEFIYFCHIANGSLCEVETQITIANKLEFIKTSIFNSLVEKITELRKMIFGFIKNLKQQNEK